MHLGILATKVTKCISPMTPEQKSGVEACFPKMRVFLIELCVQLKTRLPLTEFYTQKMHAEPGVLTGALSYLKNEVETTPY